MEQEKDKQVDKIDAVEDERKDSAQVRRENISGSNSLQGVVKNPNIAASKLSGTAATKEVILSVLVFFVLLLIWAYFAKFQNIASARGELVSVGSVEFVQHLEGGMIDKYFVARGDIVHKGDLIATLKDPSRVSQSILSNKRLMIDYLTKERLQALLNHRKPNFERLTNDKELIEVQRRVYEGLVVYQQQQINYYDALIRNKKRLMKSMRGRLASAKKQLILVSEQVIMREKLYSVQGASKLELNNAKIERLNQKREIESLAESLLMEQDSLDESYIQKKQMISLKQVEYNTQYKEVEASIAELIEIGKVDEDKASRLVVKSPIYGVIRDLPISNSSGVIAPRGVIAEIVPLKEGLKAEVRINPKDIGFVSRGQKVAMKFDTYDFSRFGSVEGVVSRINTGTFNDPDTKEIYYLGEVTLKQEFVESLGHKYVLVPGMEMTADIKIGKSRAIDYLIKPIKNALHEAFREK